MFRTTKNNLEQDIIIHKIVRIQKGDVQLRNAFLYNYKPFILQFTSKTCKIKKDIEKSEAFALAFAAFHEAIYQYRVEEDGLFTDYAKRIMAAKLSQLQKPHDTLNQLKKDFAFFHIQGASLVRGTPRDPEYRKVCIYIAKMILEDPILQQKMDRRRGLPINQISLQTGINRKMLLQYRKYIFTLVLLMKNNIHIVNDYIGGYIQEVMDYAPLRDRR